MKKRNVLAAFAVCLILFQMNLFSEEQAKNVMTYSFASKELAGFQLKISPVPVDKTQYHDNVKKIQIVKDDVVEAEYTTLHIWQNNLGEGLKFASKIVPQTLTSSFLQKLVHSLRFLASLRNRVFNNSKVDTFFVVKKYGRFH